MNILIVDDHQLFRAGVVLLMRNLNPQVEAEEAESCEDALERIAARCFDVILLDLKMNGISGLPALKAVKDSVSIKPPPWPPVVVLSGNDSREMVFESFNAGASGFISKSTDPETFMRAIQHVLAGQIFMPRHVIDGGPSAEDGDKELPLSGPQRIAGLSGRDMDVIRGLMRGESNKEIARSIGVEVSTVKKHLERIYPALGVHSRLGVCIAATRLNISWLQTEGDHALQR